MSIEFILFLGAAISFGLGAAAVPSRVSWDSLGFCLLTIALFLV